MLTVTSEPKRIVPGQFDSFGIQYEGHAFFEASSMRKIGSTYYFIYSSEQEHELCYATSAYPDRDFTYRGTIISNGDIGYHGRKAADRLNATGNNHGSIEKVGDRWFVFYHRPTHANLFSRQGCAEEIYIDSQGNIAQVEMTSAGLNGVPLLPEGAYAAGNCCNLTNGHMPHLTTVEDAGVIPCITSDGQDRFVGGMTNGTYVQYKYFAFSHLVKLQVTLRGDAGKLRITVGPQIIEINLEENKEWHEVQAAITMSGTYPLQLMYCGEGKMDIQKIVFSS